MFVVGSPLADASDVEVSGPGFVGCIGVLTLRADVLLLSGFAGKVENGPS